MKLFPHFCLLVKIAVCMVAMTSMSGVAKPSVTWQTYEEMKADIQDLSVHPDNEYVYQQLRLIIDSLPSIVERTRSDKSYQPDLMWALNTWQTTLETLSLYTDKYTGNVPNYGVSSFAEKVLRDCEAWHFAFGVSWGENVKLWDNDTQAFWQLVTKFCEGEIRYGVT